MKSGITKGEFGGFSTSVVQRHVVVLDNSHASMRLCAGGNYPIVGIAYPGLGYSGFIGVRAPCAYPPGGVISSRPGTLGIHQHIDTVVLHGLEDTDRDIELHSFFDIGNRHIQHRLHAPHHLAALGDGSTFKGFLYHAPPLVKFTE